MSDLVDVIGVIESPIVSIFDGVLDSVDDGVKGISSIFNQLSLPILVIGGGVVLMMVLKK
jgi:hypothetical protein